MKIKLSSSLGLRQIAIIATLGALLIGALVAALTWSSYQQTARVAQVWQDFEAGPGRKSRLLGQLRDSIGYGGMIHQFKNFVLRHDLPRVARVDAAIERAEALIAELRALSVDRHELQALLSIETVVGEYKRNLAMAREMVERGIKSPRILDRKVKIDDAPALAALDVLDKLQLVDRGASTAYLSNSVDELRRLLIANLVTVLFGSLAMVALILVSLSMIRSRVGGEPREVEHLARQMARGELTEVAAYANQTRGGILGELLTTLANLRAMIDGMKQAAVGIGEQSSRNLQANSDLKRDVDNQAEVLASTVSAMAQMSAAIDEVAQAAAEAVQGIETARNEARAGGAVVDDSVRIVTEVARQMNVSATAVEALGRQSESIGMVLDVIRGIAEQTNLLALNAAIEAARAGESGRGFAVVAEEVRTLASRTQESTAEIQSTIEALRGETRNAIETMNRSCEQVTLGVDRAQDANRSLLRIDEAVSNVAVMNERIASAAEQQLATANHVGETIREVSQASDRSSANAQIAASASEALAQQRETLQALGDRFKTQ